MYSMYLFGYEFDRV